MVLFIISLAVKLALDWAMDFTVGLIFISIIYMMIIIKKVKISMPAILLLNLILRRLLPIFFNKAYTSLSLIYVGGI